MKKYTSLILLILWGCNSGNSLDADLANNNPKSFSIMLSPFFEEQSPRFDPNVLAYAKINQFNEDSLIWMPLPFNDIVHYFPKTASLLLKQRDCSFFLLRQVHENATVFYVPSTIEKQGALINRFSPKEKEEKNDKVCSSAQVKTYWGFLVKDCSNKLGDSLAINYEEYESSSWQCGDFIPFNTQEEWISPSIL